MRSEGYSTCYRSDTNSFRATSAWKIKRWFSLHNCSGGEWQLRAFIESCMLSYVLESESLFASYILDHATSKHIYYSQWYRVCECTRVCAFHYTDGLNLHQDTLSPFSVPQVMVGLSRIIQQCWLHEAQARLTSLRIKKSLANLRELLRDTKEPGQPWSTPSLQ